MSNGSAAFPIPTNLRDYILKYENVKFNDTTPAAPGGATNVTWQTDEFGNISASAASGGGGGGVGTGVVGDAAVYSTTSGVVGASTLDGADSVINIKAVDTTDTGSVATVNITAGENGATATFSGYVNISAYADHSVAADSGGGVNLSSSGKTNIQTNGGPGGINIQNTPFGSDVSPVNIQNDSGDITIQNTGFAGDIILTPVGQIELAGQVKMDGFMVGRTTAPSGATGFTGWCFSQDGKISYANGSVWAVKVS